MEPPKKHSTRHKTHHRHRLDSIAQINSHCCGHQNRGHQPATTDNCSANFPSAVSTKHNTTTNLRLRLGAMLRKSCYRFAGSCVAGRLDAACRQVVVVVRICNLFFGSPISLRSLRTPDKGIRFAFVHRITHFALRSISGGFHKCGRNSSISDVE